MNRFKISIVAVVAAVLASFSLAGCGDDKETYPTPTTWVVAYQGQPYCGYIYDAHEIDMYGSAITCTRVAYPSFSEQVVAGTLHAALLAYLLTYDGFYHSGFWYDQYYAPVGARYHVTIINKTTYINTSKDFRTKYASDIKQSEGKAKWSNNKTGAYDFPSSNKKAKDKAKPLTNSNNMGGYSGTENSSTSARNKNSSTSGKSGSSGKSGTTRSTTTRTTTSRR